MQKTTSLIGDLTSVFSARSRFRKSINYEALNNNLKNSLGITAYDDTVFFTLFKPDNEKQASFVKTLTDIGWDVVPEFQRNVRKVEDPRQYRFDARMASEIALSESDRVIVISDSFELAPVMKQVKDISPDVDLFVAFFSEALDNRWWKLFNSDDPFVKFIDLDELI